MEFFSGLDVSIDETAICVVDDKGEVHLRIKVATDPEAIVEALRPFLPRLRRVGHEAGSLSPWLQPELKSRGLPAICLETYHVRAAMAAQRNKTDAADAWPCPYHAHRLVPPGAYQDRSLLPDAAFAGATAHLESQVSRH
jgi:transposase